jgi:hypothetical protein
MHTGHRAHTPSLALCGASQLGFGAVACRDLHAQGSWASQHAYLQCCEQRGMFPWCYVAGVVKEHGRHGTWPLLCGSHLSHMSHMLRCASIVMCEQYFARCACLDGAACLGIFAWCPGKLLNVRGLALQLWFVCVACLAMPACGAWPHVLRLVLCFWHVCHQVPSCLAGIVADMVSYLCI